MNTEKEAQKPTIQEAREYLKRLAGRNPAARKLVNTWPDQVIIDCAVRRGWKSED